MKGFLLDENLPGKLAFVPSLPVSSVKLVGVHPTDHQIWEYARRENLVVVTKDVDFSDRIIVTSPPPWVVHLRFGNVRLKDFQSLLARVWPQVELLLKDHKLVNVFADRVEGVS